MKAIIAVDINNGIGKNNKLPDFKSYAPNDMKEFREYTTNKTVVMGSKTFWSLPKRPLPNRENVVITTNPNNKLFDQYRKEIRFVTMDDFVQWYSSNESSNEWIVIGGAKILNALYPYLHEVRVTSVNADLACDVFVTDFISQLLMWRIEVAEFTEKYNVALYTRFIAF